MFVGRALVESRSVPVTSLCWSESLPCRPQRLWSVPTESRRGVYWNQSMEGGMSSVATNGMGSKDTGDTSDSHHEDVLRRHKQMGTAAGYRHQCKLDGWASSLEDVSLYPDDDACLQSLLEDGELWPFEKHLPGFHSPYERLGDGGFITGKEAIEGRGIDLRLFYDETRQKVRGCVRFDGRKASIGAGFLLPTHGGAIETCLDEATAELGKMTAFPFLATRKISFEIKKGVPVDVSLLVECSVVEIKGLRCYVHGEILGYGDAGNSSVVYATCDAELVNMVNFL